MSINEEFLRIVRSMENHKIIIANYDSKLEGEFSLMLDDGRVISFTSTGDDATYTSISELLPVRKTT